MISNLPKQLLWTDMKDISEMKSNKLRKQLDGIVSLDQTMNFGLWSELDKEGMLILYNEAFYLCTRIVYEHNVDASPETYLEDVKSKLGDERAYYIAFLMFYILLLQSDKSEEVVLFTDKLQKAFLLHSSSKIMNLVNKMFKPRKNNVEFRLKPYPNSANELQKIPLDWHRITQGFSKHIIVELLDLWDSEDEKGKVIRLIEQAYMSLLPVIKEDEVADKADKTFFIQQKIIYNVTNNKEGNVNKGILSIDKYFRFSNVFVRNTIEMLVQEFYLGEAVNLALIEVVLYDHGQLIKRNNHKSLVKILKQWGALPQNIDEELTANGMSQKMRKLPEAPYKEWNNQYLDDQQKCINIGNKLPLSMKYGR